MKFIDQVPRFALKMRILEVAPQMVMSHFSTNPVLVLSFDFGLTGSKLSLIEIWGIDYLPTLCLKCVMLINTR